MRCFDTICHERRSLTPGLCRHEGGSRMPSGCSQASLRFGSGMDGPFEGECKWVLTEYIDDLRTEPFRHQHHLDGLQPGLVHWPQNWQVAGDGFGDDNEAVLLRLVLHNPGETRDWLARVIGWTDTRTKLTLDRLSRRKLVRIRRVGRAVCVYPIKEESGLQSGCWRWIALAFNTMRP